MPIQKVKTPFKWTSKVTSMWDFMWMVFDYYDQLEDKIFSKIVQETSLEETVSTQKFLEKLDKKNHVSKNK